MDMFMDKLAQKLTAQEMIKANTAADTEELNRLKDRLKEYNDCLDRLKAIVEEGDARLKESKSDSGQVARLVDEAIQKIHEIKQDSEALEEWKAEFVEKLEGSGEGVHRECVKVYRNVQAVVVEESAKQTEGLDRLSDTAGKASGKLNAVLGISIAALVLSLGSVVVQVMNLLNFKFF